MYHLAGRNHVAPPHHPVKKLTCKLVEDVPKNLNLHCLFKEKWAWLSTTWKLYTKCWSLVSAVADNGTHRDSSQFTPVYSMISPTLTSETTLNPWTWNFRTWNMKLHPKTWNPKYSGMFIKKCLEPLTICHILFRIMFLELVDSHDVVSKNLGFFGGSLEC